MPISNIPRLQAPPQDHLSPVLAISLSNADDDGIVDSIGVSSNQGAECHYADIVLFTIFRNGSLLHPGVDLDLIDSRSGLGKLSKMSLITARL